MSRNVLLAIIAIVIVLGGIGAYVVSNKDNQSNDSTEQASDDGATGEQQNDNDNEPVFSAKATAGEPFVATMSGTANESSIAATIRYDGKGNSHYSGVSNGETSEFYNIDGQYIFCSEGQCFASPTSTGLPISSDQYEYDDEDVSAWNEIAVYKGKQSCPAGSCDTWEVSQEGYVGTIFIAGDGRISRTNWVGEGSSMTMDYSYEDVTITAPENVQTIPGA